MQKPLALAQPVSIMSVASFSPLGNNAEEVWKNYLTDNTLITRILSGNKTVSAVPLPDVLKHEVLQLRQSNSKYAALDDSVLFGILASRQAIKAANWKGGDNFGINIGSSRGATGLFEQHYETFLKTGSVAVQASPSTTLGNISSWIAQDLKSSGPEISHSITCSTALHAVLNGVAWLRAGMANKFLVGGSEAPLTPFTFAQMQAMKIYSSLDDRYPCRALDLLKRANTMVLGEGAASACLEAGYNPDALGYIEGIGYGTEELTHSVSISHDAQSLQKSMQMALKDTAIATVDAIVMHAPGTIKGDASEYAAIQKVFDNAIPLLTTNKWKIGHTFGASGLLSLELALLMIKHNRFIGVPYLPVKTASGPIRKVLVNAVGFGGNAVSVLVSK